MKCGELVCFHGAFNKKSDAVAKEGKVGGFIQGKFIRGAYRYVVMTRKRARKKK